MVGLRYLLLGVAAWYMRLRINSPISLGKSATKRITVQMEHFFIWTGKKEVLLIW